MKILLIEPAKAPRTIGGEDVFLYEPLALEYLAAGVSKDHDVRILDLRLEKDLPAVVERSSPDVVGITSYTVHVNTVRKLFEQIKDWNPLTSMPRSSCGPSSPRPISPPVCSTAAPWIWTLPPLRCPYPAARPRPLHGTARLPVSRALRL